MKDAKIIYFPDRFKTGKKISLTPLMVDTLLEACEKQHKNIPFTTNDIKGSFSVLINRGLIVKGITVHSHQESWQVTKEAIEILKDMGLIVDC